MYFLLFLFTMSVACWGETLFFRMKDGDNCLLKTLEITTKKETVLLSLKGSCPENIIWDEAEKTFFYALNGEIYKYSYQQTPGITNHFGKIPGEKFKFWLDEKTNKLVAVSLMSIPEKDVTSTSKDSLLIHTYLFEGKKYVDDALPSWGLPYMALLFELDKDKWKRVEIKPTKSDAGDTPHFSVLSGYNNRKPAKMDVNKLLMDSTCMGDLNCSSEDSIAKKILGKQDGYGSLKNSSESVVYFSVIYGDTPHASAPAYFCVNSCDKPLLLNSATHSDNQLSFSSHKNYFFIGEEYTNNNPQIFDATNGKLVLSLLNASHAVWVK